MFLKSIFLLVSALLFVKLSQAQEQFQPSGNPFSRIYFNLHSNFDGNPAGFDITRAYLGYSYNMSEKFSGEITLDVAESKAKINDTTSFSTSPALTAFLKTAALTYKNGNFQAELGMIGLRQFKVQEDFWGFRYIEESFQDLYDLGPSADIGILFDYKLLPMLSIDLIVRNGEGYKELQSDNAFNTGGGITFGPVRGLTLRGFYDYMKDGAAQYTAAYFVGYENKLFSLGFEYNVQSNHKNLKGKDLNGYSVFTAIPIANKIKLFGRYDGLLSNTLQGEANPWNHEKDGSLIITGAEYSPLDNVQIALNYRGWNPEDNDRKKENFIFLNFQFVF